MSSDISPRHLLLVLCVALAAGAVLLALGRPPICTCGQVDLWHGAIDSGNSQHITDWYSPSHVIHGFLFYAIGWALLRKRSMGARLVAAVVIEAAWEIAENSPIIIDRYRTATIALGYTGDSILNSMADIGCMILGFLIARRLPVSVTIAVGVALEILTLLTIRDNLTLNVLMLVWPIEAMKTWQGG